MFKRQPTFGKGHFRPIAKTPSFCHYVQAGNLYGLKARDMNAHPIIMVSPCARYIIALALGQSSSPCHYHPWFS
jgi:hypothetical protein